MSIEQEIKGIIDNAMSSHSKSQEIDELRGKVENLTKLVNSLILTNANNNSNMSDANFKIKQGEVFISPANISGEISCSRKSLDKELQKAVCETINQQAQYKGSPLWNAIKGVGMNKKYELLFRGLEITGEKVEAVVDVDDEKLPMNTGFRINVSVDRNSDDCLRAYEEAAIEKAASIIIDIADELKINGSGASKRKQDVIHIVDGNGEVRCKMERPSTHDLSEKIKELSAYDVDAKLKFIAALMPTELLKSI
ncbi:hypothetical protein WB67_15105 [bacteria symbiont BFo2 of Frankliniella occidentalis]|nr:hypothetical protein WB60_13360 [bacteria symbiont BFo2 of Frankliniella occidentalis]KYP92976.1 hypothetical protein WB67_15105 [bacteria symbiont BFo2 of Frankliniella occidentalis]